PVAVDEETGTDAVESPVAVDEETETIVVESPVALDEETDAAMEVETDGHDTNVFVTVVDVDLAPLLADGLVPSQDLQAFLDDVAGRADGAGGVTLGGLVEALGARTQVTSAGDRSLGDLHAGGGRMDILGEVHPGRMEPLRIEGFADGGRSVNLRSRGGDDFSVPADDLSALWSRQGRMVITGPKTADPPPPGTEDDGGLGDSAKVALAGALLLPIVARAGLLARRRMYR
ncbi:MAG: hypothetical protein ACRDYV_06300, partial [Acidimicrobiia bacterium]